MASVVLTLLMGMFTPWVNRPLALTGTTFSVRLALEMVSVIACIALLLLIVTIMLVLLLSVLSV